MKKYSFISLMSVACLLAACSSQKYSAPVMERNADGQLVEVQRTQPAKPPVVQTPAQPSGPGYYTVKKGDTLTHIALDFGQNYHDLVTWNNLANPNDIKVDQVLRVLPPTADNSNASGNPQVTSVPVPMQDTAVRSSLNGPASATAVTSTVGNANKTAPRGDKRPYSDATLAELQKPDAAPQVAVAVAAPTASPVAAPTAADTAADSPVASDESVSWMWPTDGKLLGSYEEGKKGIDIGGKSGQQVVAAASGKVLYAGTMRGYGNLVIVKHSANFLSAYAHNKTISVKEGQSVTKGQAIAEMGDTDTDSVKLHFEVRQQGKPVDPTKYLPPR